MVLCGREVEQGVIAGLLEDAHASRSAVLVLRGQPGVGKSALLEDVAGRAEGMLILRAAGVEFEAEFAFAGLHQLLRPVLDRLERDPGSFGSGSSSCDRRGAGGFRRVR